MPYELRTYTLRVGAMAEAVKLYQDIGFPARERSRCSRVRSVTIVAAVSPQWREDGARNRSTDVKGAVRPRRRWIKLPRQHEHASSR